MAGDGVPYQPHAATLDFEDRDRTVSLPEQRFARIELPDARAFTDRGGQPIEGSHGDAALGRHELAQQPMEMVRAALPRGRVAPTPVKARAYATLDGFDDRFVFHLDVVQRAARALPASGLVPDVRTELDARAIDRLRTYAVERQSPRIEVEHQVGEDPPVVGRDTSAVIDGARRRVESDLAFFRQRNLQA